MALASEIKKSLDIPVIVGGVHISTLPSCLGDFDLGVIGEGEETMLELMRIFERHNRFPKEELIKTDGIVFKEDDGRLNITKRRELIESLDSIPFPDRSFLNKKHFEPKWRPILQEKTGHMDILTSRGCPYRCVFCSTSLFWQRYRFRSPENVCEEIKQVVDNYKIRNITFGDDLFTVDKERLKKIAALIEQNGLNEKATFGCMSRANLFDDELCQILKRMNVKYLNFGFESGSERVLKFLKTGNVTVEDNNRAVMLCKKYGFRTTGSFIIGNPYETIEDMKQTIELMKTMKKLNEDIDIWTYVMTPFPGTEIWEIAKKRGKVSDDMKDWGEINIWSSEYPMLLDDTIDRNEFKKTFAEARAVSDSIKVGNKWIKNRIRYYPLQTIKSVLTNPRRTAGLLRQIAVSKIK